MYRKKVQMEKKNPRFKVWDKRHKVFSSCPWRLVDFHTNGNLDIGYFDVLVVSPESEVIWENEDGEFVVPGEKKRKKIEPDCCANCPFLTEKRVQNSDCSYLQPQCKLKGKGIDELFTIPSWCPLEDA